MRPAVVAPAYFMLLLSLAAMACHDPQEVSEADAVEALGYEEDLEDSAPFEEARAYEATEAELDAAQVKADVLLLRACSDRDGEVCARARQQMLDEREPRGIR